MSTGAEAILETVQASGRRVLPLFQEYLRIGYFPFFTETPDESVYLTLLEQNVRAILESDILAVNPSFTGAAVRRMSQLLSVAASAAARNRRRTNPQELSANHGNSRFAPLANSGREGAQDYGKNRKKSIWATPT